MPESVNYWTPIPSPAGQLFHADSQFFNQTESLHRGKGGNGFSASGPAD
jgi:hypothetical protein